jgi:hypothetical protein
VKLKDARPEIAAAIGRMLEKPRAHRPYLVITDTVTGTFVQFCGSDQEPLLFDVPVLGIVGRPVNKQRDLPATLDHAAELAVNVLVGLNLPSFAEIKLEEGVQTEGEPS